MDADVSDGRPERHARHETQERSRELESSAGGRKGAAVRKAFPLYQIGHNGAAVRRPALLAFVLAVLLPASEAGALDLRVTDSRGTAVLVTDASIDYGGFLGSERVTDGIPVLQGDGTVLVKWADVESLTVSKRDESVKPARIEIEIVLRGGKRASAALLRQGAMKLLGRTELGEYSIDLDKVRGIAPVK